MRQPLQTQTGGACGRAVGAPHTPLRTKKPGKPARGVGIRVDTLAARSAAVLQVSLLRETDEGKRAIPPTGLLTAKVNVPRHPASK